MWQNEAFCGEETPVIMVSYFTPFSFDFLLWGGYIVKQSGYVPTGVPVSGLAAEGHRPPNHEALYRSRRRQRRCLRLIAIPIFDQLHFALEQTGSVRLLYC